MGVFSCLRLIWLLFIAYQTSACSSQKFSPQYFEVSSVLTPGHSEFEQHATEFWTYDRASGAWLKVDISKFTRKNPRDNNGEIKRAATDTETEFIHPYSGRVSLIKFTEVSLWSSGHSGSIYERLWNGVQWVIIPHDLPDSAGYGTGVYSVNRTMLTLSDSGRLYQLQIDAEGHLHWASSGPWPSSTPSTESSSIFLKKSAFLSSDGSSLFFTTADGWLAELWSLSPVRWTNHGHPRGGDVGHVVDAGGFRAGVIFTVSTNGDLYEYDANAKPAWRKHIRDGSSVEDYELAPVSGFSARDFAGSRTFSLFLLTKNGLLVERRLAQAKWRWVLHAKPPNARLSLSLGPVFTVKNGNTKNLSFFLVSEHGVVYEYNLPFLHGNIKSTTVALHNGTWTDHGRPADAPVMVSVPGVALSLERIFFTLQDGRLGELHLDGFGGTSVGPISRSSLAKKRDGDYVWSVFEAPESEGGNSDYCSTSLGPSNCLEGIMDRSSDFTGDHREQQQGIFHGGSTVQEWFRIGKGGDLFRARALLFGKSIFFVGRDGAAAERFFNGKVWLWLRHDFAFQIRAVLGVYNASVFVTDFHGSLLMREWNGNALQWLNCSALVGGSTVISGSPWDGHFGDVRTDAQFYISPGGDLLEFIVAFRAFSWKNCGHPPDTPVAAIVDQEVFRYRVIFVIGTNGKLYQFNRVTSFWHTYQQQPTQLRLSPIPGVVYRPSFLSTSGSLFMRSENGNLVEFGWDSANGWFWSDHGTPAPNSYVATSPGPCMDEDGSVFVVSSTGRVHARQLFGGKWRWRDFGHPLAGESDEKRHVFVVEDSKTGNAADLLVSFEGECDTTIDSVRPVASSKDTVAFVLRDGRLAELKRDGDGSNWEWVSIVDTPASSCLSSYWTQDS
ncbi:uncharacterized protein LOC112349635 [Selaginella moellendorffii]|uniref:uncharacterized protein LOC112349635 n=1 Tax=Selaginella moellendorffii TaxID=88036 RepID=UPI000D1CA38B|nr:uncharacterized protein LOC112349635 [Selaginella moellendorffii]|eukprot:XP_024540156.1 uncharacterized protein LOC112349635 [Selaginella moellendorffii]